MIIDGGNSQVDRRQRRAEALSEQGIDYVDVGTSGGVWGLQVGYCMMVGGPDEAVSGWRRSSTCWRRRPPRSHGTRRRSRLGALRRGRRRPLREDGPQRHRVRDHAGLRRGLRPVRQVRLRARQREDRAPVDAGLGGALVAVRAGRAGLRAGGQRPGRPAALHRPTPARAAGRSRTRWTRTCPRR